MNRHAAGPPTEGRDDGPEGGGGTLQQMGHYGGHGLTIGGATALFAWLGHLLDGWAGTGSLFVILGAAAGFAGGFYAMYRDLVLDADRPDADDGGRGAG